MNEPSQTTEYSRAARPAEHAGRGGGVTGPAPPGRTAPTASTRRIDTDALKHSCPIEEVVGRYGIDLRGRGRALVGRCPFHDDGGRPNLHIYPATESYFCYRCRIGGDVIDFVERYDGVGFREAVARLIRRAPALPARAARARTFQPASHVPSEPRKPGEAKASPAPTLGPEEYAALRAAVALYQRRLLATPAALAYVADRGLDRPTVERYRLGYAAGGELAAHLGELGLSLAAAQRAGLLRDDGSELLAGRVVIPEIRHGQPIWMIGRSIAGGRSTLRYLGLPGSKPLMGWEAALEAADCGAAVVVVEGLFDWLVLQRWGIPSVALVGTYVRPDVVQALARLGRLYLVFDWDDAGAEASDALLAALAALGCHAVAVRLPAVPDVKDVADLGPRPDGRALFVQAVERTAHTAA